jgi:tetratricopeptide (TPR) repeat protein
MTTTTTEESTASITITASIAHDAHSVRTVPELARLLRQLRRREARRRDGTALTYRELAAKTGWSHAIIGEYLTGAALPPTDRFDLLIQILGATREELGPLATARDRVEELRRPGRPAPAVEPSAVTEQVPRELPAPVPGFVGRRGQLEELASLAAPAGRGLAVAAICGSGGVGKTALAVHWAQLHAERFPDGQLYVDLRGYGPGKPVDPADALAGFLSALGIEHSRMPTGTDERAARYRTLLAGRHMLIVLDNASSAEQVRPLLPGSPTCMVVVTSRDSLAGLVATDGAARLELDVLTEAEALTLLRSLVGERVDAAPDEARAMVALCGRLPLALRIAAELAASRADATLSDLVADLRDQQGRLDLLDAGDTRSAVRSVLSWSYQRLSPAAARLFRLLGCDPGPDIGVRAVASLGAVTVAAARRMLGELARAHMLTESAPGRYTLHDVLRAYAAELMHGDQAEDRRAAIRRLLDHYLHTAAAADRQLDPTRVRIELSEPAEDAIVTYPDSPSIARDWFQAERATLLAVVRHARDHGFADHAWQLAWTMANFLDRGGFWLDWATVNAVALEAAIDPVAKAQSHRGFARAATRLRLFTTAREHYEQAAALFEAADDRLGLAVVQVNLSELHLTAGRTVEALGHEQRALDLFRAMENDVGQAVALNNIGFMHGLLGEYPAALKECNESLALWRRLGDHGATAPVLDSLGYVHHRMGEHSEAIRHFQEALTLHRERGHRFYQASVLTHLGDAYIDCARSADARDAWCEALSILEDLGHPDAMGVRARLAAC